MRAATACRATILGSVAVVTATRASAQLGAGRDSTRLSAVPAVRGLPFATLPDVDGAEEDLWRMAQLRGASTAGSQLRSPSSMMTPDSSPSMSWKRPTWAVVVPSVEYTRNSSVPFSMNDGALWAGKGQSMAIAGGVRVEWGRLQIALKPQLIHEANLSLPFYNNLQSGLPYTLPPYRSVYSTLWNIFPHGADIPFRFGDRRRFYGDAGQSSASLGLGAVRAGVSTENEWWGPGIQNALLLSNAAAGVPRLFVRSARPLHTPLGGFESS